MQKQFMGVAALGAALAIGDASHAQAVQWKVSDGGDGHWYQVTTTNFANWSAARLAAEAGGAHLVTISTEGEWNFIRPRAVGCYLGGYQDTTHPDWSEPAGGWRWITGEAWTVGPWAGFGPDDAPCYVNNGDGQQDVLWLAFQSGGIMDDIEANPVSYCPYSLEMPAVFEWSADCNNDGIVDYGQCRDGSLPDYNGNNVPDCCETGQACAVGNYPVQWRTSDGGNGSWYRIVNRSGQGAIDWSQSRASAQAIGGDLAVLSTAAENAAFVSLTRGQIRGNPWIGLYQDRSSPDFAEPAGGWRWVNGEPLSWTNWSIGEPNNVGSEDWAVIWLDDGPEGRWNDYQPTVPQGPDGYVIEWSADCNADGIVDYGQILQGQLPDTNNNGVPDSCEVLTCANADLFRDSNINGADLGILLAQWGEANPQTVSDINRDGAVDGVDLGLLLSFWGPCPD
jgi:hypothetical protein